MKKILISLTLLAFTAVFAAGCAAEEDDSLLRDVTSVKLSIHPSDASAAQPDDSSIPITTKFYASANTAERKFIDSANLFESAGGVCSTQTSTIGKLVILCRDNIKTITFTLDAPGYDPNGFFKLGYYSLFGQLVRDVYEGWARDGRPNVLYVDNSSYNNQTVLP